MPTLKPEDYRCDGSGWIMTSVASSFREDTGMARHAGQTQSPFFPRLFERANLWVGLWLSGIRNAEAVRDLIRNAGQIEAGRINKARFR
jgi:hypothetical protein